MLYSAWLRTYFCLSMKLICMHIPFVEPYKRDNYANWWMKRAIRKLDFGIRPTIRNYKPRTFRLLNGTWAIVLSLAPRDAQYIDHWRKIYGNLQ